MSLKFFIRLTSVFSFIFLFGLNTFAYNTVSSNQPTERKKKLVDFDISGSAGNYNGHSYTEIHLGLNLNFTDWLTWRNSVFKRMTAGSSQEVTGLDSSVRFVEDLNGINLYAGPGYRWTSDSNKNALLGEAGASVSVGRVSLGAGAKYLRYDQAQYDASGAEIKRDDFSYFVAISGGAGLSF